MNNSYPSLNRTNANVSFKTTTYLGIIGFPDICWNLVLIIWNGHLLDKALLGFVNVGDLLLKLLNFRVNINLSLNQQVNIYLLSDSVQSTADRQFVATLQDLNIADTLCKSGDGLCFLTQSLCNVRIADLDINCKECFGLAFMSSTHVHPTTVY